MTKPKPHNSASTHASMVSPAKLEIPLLPARYAERETLRLKMEAAFRQKLTCVVAPSGYGKTCALAWHARHTYGFTEGDATAAGTPNATAGTANPNAPTSVAWVTADERDADPGRFWLHVATALGIDDKLDFEGPFDDAFLESAARVLYDTTPESETLLVIDDFEAVKNAQVEDGLLEFLAQTPRGLHAVVSASSLSEGMFVKAYALGHDEVVSADLAFTLNEIAELMGPEQPEEASTRVYAETAGWPQGVALAMRALESWRPGTSVLNGTSPIVRRHFSATVKPAVSPETLDFMARLAFVERFTPSLVEAVFGTQAAHACFTEISVGGVALIEPCDPAGEWLRFNPLLAGWLRASALQAPYEDIRALSLRVSEWFYEHGRRNEAAKYITLTADSGYVESVVEACTGLAREDAEVPAILWLARIPAADFPNSPLLCMLAAWSYNASGRIAEALEWTDLFRQAASADGLDPDTVEFAAQCMVMKCKTMSEEGVGARKFCEDLMEGEYRIAPSLMSMFYQSLAEACERSDDMKQAEEMYLQAQASASIHRMPHQLFFNMYTYAELQLRRGKYIQVDEICTRILSECPDDLVSVGAAKSLLALVYIEKNRMDEAEQCVEDALQRCSWYRNIDSYIESKIAQASLLESKGRLSDSYEAISECVMRCEDMAVPRARQLVAYFKQAEIAKRRHNQHDLRVIEKKFSAKVDESDGYRKLLLGMVKAFLLEESGASDEALLAYADVASAAKDAGLVLVLVKAQMAQAALLYATGEKARAIGVASDLLPVAKAYAFLRSFVDADRSMTELLKEYSASRHASPSIRGYVKLILAESDKRAALLRESREGERMDSAFSASDVLSDRENEVMHLLDMGLSRKEISEKLHISLNTTKKHLSNVYAKLGVTRREEAIEIHAKMS